MPGAVVWCARRWDKKNNKEINIEIIYTHVNIPSVLHASSQTPHHSAMIGLITDIRDWKSSGIMWLKSGSHDSHIFFLQFTTTSEVKLKKIVIVFQKQLRLYCLVICGWARQSHARAVPNINTDTSCGNYIFWKYLRRTGHYPARLRGQMLVAIFRPKYLHPLAVKNDWCGEIKINTFTHNLAKREGGCLWSWTTTSGCKISHFWINVFILSFSPNSQSHGQTFNRV